MKSILSWDSKNVTYKKGIIVLTFLIFLIVLQNIFCSYIVSNALHKLELSYKDLPFYRSPIFKYIEYLLYLALMLSFLLAIRSNYSTSSRKIIIFNVSIIIIYHLVTFIYCIIMDLLNKSPLSFISGMWSIIFIINLKHYFFKKTTQNNKTFNT